MVDDGDTPGVKGETEGDIYMLNAKKLILLREVCGWTRTQMLEALAKEQGIYCSYPSLCSYELGRVKNPRTEIIQAIARLYDVKLEELLIS